MKENPAPYGPLGMTGAAISRIPALPIRSLLLGIGGAAIVALSPGHAVAQDTDGLIVTPVIPVGYDRGRNVSVAERPRPDYDPLGIRSGGFLIYPRLDVGIGASTNVYLSENNDNGDLYALVSPSVRAVSDWSRHQLSASLGGTARRFFTEPRRNEDSWRGAVLGRADIGNAYSITGDAQAGKIYETPFSGEIDSSFAALSSYNYAFVGVRGQYEEGRSRLVLSLNRNGYEFNSINAGNGLRIGQSDRDRTIDTVAGQFERAWSPSVSLYGQLSYSHTDYNRLVATGVADRSSDGYRAIGGVSVDIPALARGTLGIGYTIRNYDSRLFRRVEGLSVEGRLEYFYSELTTATVGIRRAIADSTLADTSAYFDNRVSARIDHELLSNMILNAGAEYSRQDYVDSDRRNDVYRVGAGARYLLSNSLSLNLGTAYSRRERSGANYNGRLNELRGEISLSFRH